MDRFRSRLNQARKGHGILFCGAGFTADCLNFSDNDSLGVTQHLLNFINSELRDHGAPSGFRDIKNASLQFQRSFGEYEFMRRLNERFTLSHVSENMVEICRYPWEKIYTTNFDNGIELSLQRAAKAHTPLNNLDDSNSTVQGVPIIHLHGYINKWDIKNFQQSCILDSTSYFNLERILEWLDRLRFDLERAEIAVFVGFSASDFHLNQVLFNASGLKDKTFFINRPTANPDPDQKFSQEEFGTTLFLGRQGLVNEIHAVSQQPEASEPLLASFVRYVPVEASPSVPPVTDIEDLFLFGKTVPQHLARDHTLGRSDYHVLRSVATNVKDLINNGTRIILISGEICDGKTLILSDLSRYLAVNRPVFHLRHPYDDLLDEVSGIIHIYPRAALVVENCFDIAQARLGALANLFDNSEGLLLLSSRNIAAEAETAKKALLLERNNFREVSTGKLTSSETEALISLVDQIAGWRDFQRASKSERVRFVSETCSASLPSFLLRLLRSDYVKERYLEEYNKTVYFNDIERRAIITALYIGHIGHDVPKSFLSKVFSLDMENVLSRHSASGGALKILHGRGGFISTVPAIGATNILLHIIQDREIVDSVLYVLEDLASNARHGDFERYIFSQMMRYSILNSVVNDSWEIERFFDHISKIEYFRRQVLFWLQWHMARAALNDFPKAEDLLKQGYAEADRFERNKGNKFNRKQLDDRKAKFLMKRVKFTERPAGQLFRDFKESLEIVARLVRQAELTHHPYDTLLAIVDTFLVRETEIIEPQRSLLEKQIKFVTELATAKIDNLPQGFQRRTANDSIRSIQSLSRF